MSELKIVLTYIDNEQKAEELTDVLLREKLAACVSIIPGKSRYWWQGEIVKNDQEFHLIIKTREALVDATIKKITEVHPYDLPVIDVLDVENTNPGVLEWIQRETKQNGN